MAQEQRLKADFGDGHPEGTQAAERNRTGQTLRCGKAGIDGNSSNRHGIDTRHADEDIRGISGERCHFSR